jgi:hypothetical protein
MLDALPSDERVQRAKRAPFPGQHQDVGRGASAAPVPARKPDLSTEVRRHHRGVAGQPVVEQTESDADAAGNGRGGGVRRLGWHPVEDVGGPGGVGIGESLDGLPERADHGVPGRPDRGKASQVVPLDRPVQRRLQGGQVGDVDVVEVDAFLGQQRRQLVQRLVGQPGRKPNL